MQRPRPLFTISRPLLQRLSALLAVVAFVAASVFGIRLLGASALGEKLLATLPKRSPAAETDRNVSAASDRNRTDGQVAVGTDKNPVVADFAPAIKVLKALTSQDPATVGQEVGFRIELHNASHLPLADLTLSDTYDAGHLQYLSAEPAPATVDENEGTLSWSALETQLDDGSLDPGDVVVVELRFTALAATLDTPARNMATTSANRGQVIDGPASAELKIIEEPVARLCLGDLVFVDLADDGRLDADAGDLGIGGVALSLYADTDGDGLWSAADALQRTTRTDSDGRYGFCDLAPGDYMVLVEPANFAADGPLAGLRSAGAAGGADIASDPDDDVDGDDNGGVAEEAMAMAVAAAEAPVVSRAITLSGGGEPAEPVDGTDNSDNRTLDFGFAMREGIVSGTPSPDTTLPEEPLILRDPVRDPWPGKPVYGKPVYRKPVHEGHLGQGDPHRP